MRRHGFRGDADAFKKKTKFLDERRRFASHYHNDGLDVVCVCVQVVAQVARALFTRPSANQTGGRGPSAPVAIKGPFSCVCVCVSECVSLSLTHTDIKGVREKQNRQTKKLR